MKIYSGPMRSAWISPPGRLVWLAAVVVAIAGSAAAATLRIVTTTSDLMAITEAVAGEHATVTSIATGKQDPHFLQAKPSYIMQARRADLWIRVGMELEVGWEGPILDGARNRRIREGAPGHLDASAEVLRLDVPTERITRAMGDVHPAGNPHYWLDPLNGRLAAATIAERLAQLRPQQARTFREHLAAFQRALDSRMFGESLVEQVGGERLWALHLEGRLDAYLNSGEAAAQASGWYARLRPHRGKPILMQHRSWSYFTHRFGLEVVGELEPKPGVPPSGSHLAEITERAKHRHVKVILVEPFYNRKAADFVASRSAARVVVVANSVGGSAGATDYLSMLDQVVVALAQAWKTE